MLIQSLDGQWQLKQTCSDEQFKAHVPGCVHLDLMRSKKIADPFFGDNEFKVSWVHECDWEYTRTFVPSDDLLSSDKIFLECDGLDTIADVVLNGQHLGRAENMYVQHRYDVTDKLQPGENTLTVCFHSPVNYVKPFLEKDAFFSPGDSIPGSIYTRKSPCQWGWDWGPKIPTLGIWRPIRLAGYSVARIEDLRVRQTHRAGRVMLNIQCTLEKFRRTSCMVTIKITSPDGSVEEHEVKPSGSTAKCSVTIDKPQLWWPNGYGEQPLYKVEVSLECDGEQLNTLKRQIGLRTLKVEQRKDRYGRSFTFVVNDVKVFAKGANWIPADQFPSRISDEHYRHLIKSAAQCNMNMLRIWGGGYYEDERFYDLCDEYGILIWHDFMFSCALYPVDASYIENVRMDLEYNIVRLRNRACLALWCGNNEIEWFISNGVGGDRAALRKKQYVKIFHDLIPSTLSKLDPDTTYWPSSPSSGQKPFENPNDQNIGDGHNWEVWHGRKPFTHYRNYHFRFMSEFGFESLPALETVKTFAKPEDMNMVSHVMECHQKNSAGNGLILYYMAHTFRFPKNFEMTCYVSQLLQAEAMRYGVEHWRRNRGRCMGTLYWQLNDCWPVCSWSSVDYYGRWKALQYFAKRFYSPILLSVMEEGVKADIHVTNDTTKPARIEVRWSLEKLDGTVIRKSKIKTRIEGEQDKLLASLDFSDEISDDELRQTVLVAELLVNGKPAGLSLTSFVPTKHLELPSASIKVETKKDDSGSYLEVTSDMAARYVCLSIPKQDVLFSDNYFDLPANRTMIVRIASEVDEAALSKVRAYSLRDSY